MDFGLYPVSLQMHSRQGRQLSNYQDCLKKGEKGAKLSKMRLCGSLSDLSELMGKRQYPKE